jgi:lysine 2,3-aminomutase
MSYSYKNRLSAFEAVEMSDWQNWIWQEQNAIRNVLQLKKFFPRMNAAEFERLEKWQKKGLRILMTPYVLSLVEKDEEGNPLKADPVWRQVFPVFADVEGADGGRLADDAAGCIGGGGIRPDEYSVSNENWEEAAEMISPIAQHKYDNRAIIYTIDSCLGYCMYCFRALQSGDESERHGGMPHWEKTVAEIAKRKQIEEVIFSGGDPLVYDNGRLEAMLKDIRAISHVRAIRIHTRAWTHNPFRIDEEFCGLLKKYDVTEMGVHVIHSNELTDDFHAAVGRIRNSGARTLLMCDTPLIKGVNDDENILRELFMGLYVAGVKPYYLSHNMPNIPAAVEQRTSVKRGLQLYNRLKRRISNPAMPEYIITHKSGKKTVPECEEGTPDFIYAKDKSGFPIIRFKNWRGDWREYLDATD